MPVDRDPTFPHGAKLAPARHHGQGSACQGYGVHDLAVLRSNPERSTPTTRFGDMAVEHPKVGTELSRFAGSGCGVVAALAIAGWPDQAFAASLTTLTGGLVGLTLVLAIQKAWSAYSDTADLERRIMELEETVQNRDRRLELADEKAQQDARAIAETLATQEAFLTAYNQARATGNFMTLDQIQALINNLMVGRR